MVGRGLARSQRSRRGPAGLAHVGAGSLAGGAREQGPRRARSPELEDQLLAARRGYRGCGRTRRAPVQEQGLRCCLNGIFARDCTLQDFVEACCIIRRALVEPIEPQELKRIAPPRSSGLGLANCHGLRVQRQPADGQAYRHGRATGSTASPRLLGGPGPLDRARPAAARQDPRAIPERVLWAQACAGQRHLPLAEHHPPGREYLVIGFRTLRRYRTTSATSCPGRHDLATGALADSILTALGPAMDRPASTAPSSSDAPNLHSRRYREHAVWSG